MKTMLKVSVISFTAILFLVLPSFARINLFPQMDNTNLNKKLIRQNMHPKQPTSIKFQEGIYSTLPSTSKKNKIHSTSVKSSVIEQMFDNTLKQFGYELFQKSSYVTQGGAIPSNYRLNVGDRVRIYFWGETFDFMAISGASPLEPMLTSVIDREGNLFIPNVGVIYAEGKTIAEVEREIYLNLSRNYTNFQVKITVSEPRDFPVLVMGNVRYPGTVYISANSSFIDALNLAGGIQKNGSLRNIIHIDNYTKKKTPIDLYELLVKGKYNLIQLNPGDVILVNPIGKVVGLSEGVKKPAIYEFKQGETLANIVDYAGNFLPTVDLNSLHIEHFDKQTNEKQVEHISLSQLQYYTPKDGDLLKFRSLYELAENTVKLTGNIKHPGEFQYKLGMRLSDIIKDEDELLIRSYTDQAVIERVTGKEKDIQTIPVSLTDFFNGSIDPELKPMDVIKIYASTKMPMVEVAGEIINPGLIPYKARMTLFDVLSVTKFSSNVNNLVLEISNPLISGITEFADEEDVFTNITDQDSKPLTQKVNILEVNKKQVNIDRKNLLKGNLRTYYLYDLLTNTLHGRNIPLNPNDKLLFRTVTNKEALKTVRLMGYVKNPGVYKVKPGMKLIDLINIAGGLDKNAYLKGMIFMRSTVNDVEHKALTISSLDFQEEIINSYLKAQSLAAQGELETSNQFLSIQQGLSSISQRRAKQKFGRVILDIHSNDLQSINDTNNIELQDGDQIIIPQIPNYVVVIGEVFNQAAIVYYPEHNAKFYLEKVGGPTKRARKRGTFILKANGSVIKPKNLNKVVVDPGDSIIVPKKVKVPINIRGIVKDLAQIGANAAQTLFILDRL